MVKYYYINNEDSFGIINKKMYKLLIDNKLMSISDFKSSNDFNTSLSNLLKSMNTNNNSKSDDNIHNSKKVSTNNKSNSKLPLVEVWTDGGSRNTGNVKGGHVKSGDNAAWAYKIQVGSNVYEDSATEQGATNNKMELVAIKESLSKLLNLKLNNNKVIVYSDSMYAINTVTKWMYKWKKSNWNRYIKNLDVIKDIYSMLFSFDDFNMQWVKGHTEYTDNKHAGNISVDNLLNSSMDKVRPRKEYDYSNISDGDATVKQINYLKHLDRSFKARDGLTKKEASQLIREYISK